MNHTIKGIIIVVVITSMLFVGASMVPIMQNSFAYKKSDFKQVDRDPNTNTNTNTNTNSADSTLSSDATAHNTNNINNSVCTVAVTCPKGSIPTPIGISPPPLTAATCNPSTVSRQIAIPTDGTCIATLPADSSTVAIIVFENRCRAIPGGTVSHNEAGDITCTFPSTPPT